MKKILIPIFACLSFFSCEKLNPNKEAAPLLEEARQAVIDKDFAKAHAMIDSIRSAYPRATEVRWAALYFEDTINLEEAKVQSREADSIYRFGVFEFEDVSKGLPVYHPTVRAASEKLDSLKMERNRMQMKVKFFYRKIQERLIQKEKRERNDRN